MRILLLLLMFSLLQQAELTMNAASAACHLFVTAVLPGLFPYMVLSLLLTSRVKRLSPGMVLLLGWGGGSPTGARLLPLFPGLTKRQRTRLAVSCATMSPMFLLGTAGGWLGSTAAGAVVLISVIAGGWLAGWGACTLCQERPRRHPQADDSAPGGRAPSVKEALSRVRSRNSTFAGAAASKPQRGRCGDFAEDSFRVSGNSGNLLQPEPPRYAAARVSSKGQEGVRREYTFLHSPRRLCAAFDARKRPSSLTFDLHDELFFDTLSSPEERTFAVMSFGAAVEQSARTMLLVCGTMVMLRVFAALAGEWLPAGLVLPVTTLLEVTTGAQEIARLPLPLPMRTALLAGATGFGGMAILLQNRAVLPSGILPMGRQILWQGVHGCISGLIALGLMRLIC